jgi:ABC-type uncharacterized transport system involved in gliding motility auxiliary subunit
MGQQQRELRRAANRAFLESLDQLQATLHSSDSRIDPLLNESIAAERPIDLNILEQAVTDIDEFMQRRQPRG